MEPHLSKPKMLQERNPNSVQQRSDQDVDLTAEEPDLAVEKWPRGPVVRNVGLKNRVLNAGM